MSNDYVKGVLAHALRFFSWDLLSIIIAAIGSIVLSRVLGPTDRGILAVTASFCGVAAIVSIMGTNASFRSLHPRRLASVRSYFLAIRWLAPIAGLATLIVVPVSLGVMTGQPFQVGLVIGAVLLAGTNLLSLAILDASKAAGQLTLSSRVDALGALLSTSLIIAAPPAIGSPSLYVWCYVIGYALRIALGVVFLRPQLIGTERAVPEEATRVRAQGRRFMGFSIGQHLTTQSETYFVGIATGATGAGLYSVATTIAGLLKMPAAAVGQILNLESAHGRLDWRRLRLFVLISFAITAIGATVAYAISEPLILFVFGSEFADSVAVLRVLLIAQVMFAPYPLVSRALAGHGETRAISITGVASAVASAALIFTLGAQWGVIGAAAASVITYTAISLTVLLVAWRTFRRVSTDD